MLIGALNVLLRANTAQFAKGIGSAGKMLEGFAGGALKKFGKEIGDVDNYMKTFGTTLGIWVAAGSAAAYVLQDMARHGFELNNALNKQASILGMTSSQLQKYQFAAASAGVETDQFFELLSELNIRTGDMMGGGGPLASKFAQLGLDAEKFLNLDLAGRMKFLADEVKNIDSHAGKASLLSAAFSDVGAEKALQLFNMGGDAIELSAERLETMGLALRENYAGTKLAGTGVTELGLTYDAISMKLAEELSPAILAVTDSIMEWIETSKPLEQLPEWVDWFVESLAFAVPGIEMALGVISWGFHVLTAPIVIAVRLIDLLAQAIDAVAGTSLSRFTSAAVESAMAVTEATSRYSSALFQRGSSGMDEQIILDSYEKAKAKIEGFSLQKPIQAAAEIQLAKGELSAIDLENKLIDELNMLEFGAEYMERFNLELEGATAETLERIAALKNEVQILKDKADYEERMNKLYDDRKARAADLIEGLKTPADKFSEDIAEIEGLLSDFFIDEEQYLALEKQIFDGIKGGVDEGVAYMQASEFGSSAYAQSLARYRTGQQKKDDKVEKNTKETVAVLNRIEQKLAPSRASVLIA